MKILPALLLLALTSAGSYGQYPSQNFALQQQPAAQTDVSSELTQVAALYKAGKFAEAQAHAERAVLIAPSNLTAAVFLARVRHQRYQPGDQAPENFELARAAIDAYQSVLALDPLHEEAYKAVAVLYASTHQDDLLKTWVLQRATNPQVANDKRAESYAILAGKDWDCSFKFTELPNHKLVDVVGKTAVVKWKVPLEDLGEYQQVKQCVAQGFEMVDAAILLDENSETAWSYKTNLLLEAAKLAQIEGLDLAKADYERQSKDAGEKARRLAEKRRQAEESTELPSADRPPPPAATKKRPTTR